MTSWKLFIGRIEFNSSCEGDLLAALQEDHLRIEGVGASHHQNHPIGAVIDPKKGRSNGLLLRLTWRT